MKKLLAGLLCAAMLLSLAACGGSGESTSSSQASDSSSSQAEDSGDSSAASVELPDEEVELKVYLHGFNPSINTEPTEENPNVFLSTTPIAEAYLEMHPNVTIEWVRSLIASASDEHLEKMNILVNSGNAPDIFFAWGNAFANQGWLAELDEVLQTPNEYEEGNQKWIDQFPAYMWEADQMTQDAKGNTVAVPFTCHPGAAIAYYYNVDLFEQYGKEIPTTWKELMDLGLFFKNEGYTGITSWAGEPKPSTGCWDFWASLAPAYAVGYESIDENGDEAVDTQENLKAAFKGMYYAQSNETVQEVFRQFKYKWTEVMDEGAENIDYEQFWVDGKVAMLQDGLWRLSNENSNTKRNFEFSMFVPPLVSTDTYPDVRVPEYTEAGPYQPDLAVAWNIFKPELQDRTQANFDYAADFLKYLTSTDNISMIVNEFAVQLGATKTCSVPALLTDWMKRPFAKTLVGTIQIGGFTAGTNATRNALLEQYVKDMIPEDQFFKEWDAEWWRDMNQYAEEQEIDTSGWEKVEPIA